jgi:hypothetical protein
MPSTTKTKLELHAGLVTIGACAGLFWPPAGAQEERLTVEVGECVDLATPEQRLACFEAQVEAARSAREAEAAPASRSAEPAPAARSAEPAAPGAAPAAAGAAPAAARGAQPAAPSAEPAPRVVEARVRPEPQRSAAEPRAASAEGRRPSRREQERDERVASPEIRATVAELRETVPNSYLITLDNGQVWRQTVPARYGLREGVEVHLYPTRWGDSYRLTNETLRGSIQVERVR